MNINLDADDFVSMLDTFDARALADALSKAGRGVYSDADLKEAADEAREQAQQGADASMTEALEEVRDLLRAHRFDEIELMIERELHPRRPRSTDADLIPPHARAAA